MRKDLLALAERIRVLEIELEKCPKEDRERRLGIWVEIENNYSCIASQMNISNKSG